MAASAPDGLAPRIHTPLCDLLQITHPIVLGGMASGTSAPLVAAVSNGGGLGTLGASGRSPTEIREATVKIARDTWNKYYAPTLGGKDSALLGIYSHTITSPLYLFNYVIGHLIAFQVEEHVAGKDKATFAKEFERVSRLGAILPDLWMQQATGAPVSTKPMLDAAARALGK